MSAKVEERFGPYGGRYVPETLIAALDELSEAWAQAREDEGFKTQLAVLHRDFIGRPTPLYLAERLSERAGRRVYLKREDLAHTGAHKINNAIGQALLAQRMGKPRVIAETGAGQHGVATATACALLGLECVVYMGSEDIRRQSPNVERMGLLGAEVVPVEAGARTLKEAVSEAIRDWVANVASTHYVIGSAVGPAPFPALVRDLQRVIGDESREQALAAEGGLPARVIACVGGGSNSIGIFTPFIADSEVELIGVEAAGEGLDTGRHGASLGGRADGRPARLALLGDRRRGGPDPRGALDLGRARLPGRRARARPSARHRPCDLQRGHRRAGAGRLRRALPAGGDHPGARVLPRDRLAARERRGGDGYDVLCLSGRGDKDLAEVLEQTGKGDGDESAEQQRGGSASQSPAPIASVTGPESDGARAGEERVAAAFEAAEDEGRAALMPYMMGCFPDHETSLAVANAYADAGADLIELGIPFSDPLADGPTIHAAATAALEGGANVEAALEICTAVAERLPVVLMVYANMVLAHGGAEAFASPRGRGRGRRGDRPRPAARRGGGDPRGIHRRRAGAGAACRADDPGRAPGPDLRGRPGLRLRRLDRGDHR